MQDLDFTFESELWVWQGKAAWHFITLPQEIAEQIKFFASGKKRRGWGSVRVRAQIGDSLWQTSVFPDSQSGSYLLPIKSNIRKQENLETGDRIQVHLRMSINV